MYFIFSAAYFASVSIPRHSFLSNFLSCFTVLSKLILQIYQLTSTFNILLIPSVLTYFANPLGL